MDLIRDKTKNLFLHYLGTSFASTMVMAVYNLVDAIAIGHSAGETGTATSAVAAPLFGIIVFLALCCGTGGSVLVSSARGSGNRTEAEKWFTSSLLLMILVIAVTWPVVLLFRRPIFLLFGADEALLDPVLRYAGPILAGWPICLGSVYLGCIVRNDGSPNLAALAVLCGGVFNILGDWILVFPLGFGLKGAAWATVGGNMIQLGIMLTHFCPGRTVLRLTHVDGLFFRFVRIAVTGFGSALVDFANCILISLINHQVMLYGGALCLSIYGAFSSLSTSVQTLFSAVGQAIQPLISVNHGAGKQMRIHSFLKAGVGTAVGMGVLVCLVCVLAPERIVSIFMTPSPAIRSLCRVIVRICALSFLTMGTGIVGIYYFQAVLQEKRATLLSLLRVLASGGFVLALPVLFGLTGVWSALPAAELLSAALALGWMLRRRK